jgi:hypothetical protein
MNHRRSAATLYARRIVRKAQSASIIALVVLAAGVPAASRLRAQTPDATSAKTWIGEQRRAIEDYVRTADVVSMEKIGTGITGPRRARTAPGGLIESFSWKAIAPGTYRGYWESYKGEIAAYELDKLLGLDMVPPAVERKLEGEVGAAIMWVAPTKSFKQLGGVPQPPRERAYDWSRQIIRAKMLDNLIGNPDPNLGNWLVDPAWNIVLIDHSRAFTPTAKMTHEMTFVDSILWNRMKALDRKVLADAVGAWLSIDQIEGVLRRRNTMKKLIDALVAQRGAAAVFVPAAPSL